MAVCCRNGWRCLVVLLHLPCSSAKVFPLVLCNLHHACFHAYSRLLHRKSLLAIYKSKFLFKLETVSDSTTHVGKLFQIEITLLENEYFLVFVWNFEHVFYSDALWYVDPHQNTKLIRKTFTPNNIADQQNSKLLRRWHNYQNIPANLKCN
ncbi:hypothetical protein HELRODRAFT_158699 [Helobdella robusta]|uniref:Secreted protein n=1 Tax=Helobdella robusta TaxID=6412 RepID=T1EN51_HELRO|nr:hypothetical protein HELRODRAFT_158699 [Helobdella robusta]ESO12230.1 hypothetical protein HELRODRAFT_158699 [Helobdella robusta]